MCSDRERVDGLVIYAIENFILKVKLLLRVVMSGIVSFHGFWTKCRIWSVGPIFNFILMCF